MKIILSSDITPLGISAVEPLQCSIFLNESLMDKVRGHLLHRFIRGVVENITNIKQESNFPPATETICIANYV